MVNGFWRGLCHLPHLPVRAQQLRQFYLCQIGADVPPGIATGLLNDPFESQGQHTQSHMGVDAMHRPVIDRPYPQAALEGAPGLFDPLQLLVSQRQIRWRQAIIVAMHHKFAIQLFGRTPFGRVYAQQAPFGQTQIAPIATTGPQLAHPLAVALPSDFFERRQLGFEFPQDLTAVSPLACFLVGIVAHDIATTTLAFTHHHFLDPQVLGHLLKTPRALEDVVGDLVPAAHWHTDDVFALYLYWVTWENPRHPVPGRDRPI